MDEGTVAESGGMLVEFITLEREVAALPEGATLALEGPRLLVLVSTGSVLEKSWDDVEPAGVGGLEPVSVLEVDAKDSFVD